MCVHRFDEADLFTAPPALDLLLAIDGQIGISEGFVVYKAREVVTAGKAGNQLVLMLEGAPRKVAGDARV